MMSHSNRKVFRPSDESIRKKIFTVLELCKTCSASDGDIYKKIKSYHPDLDIDLIDEILYWHG